MVKVYKMPGYYRKRRFRYKFRRRYYNKKYTSLNYLKIKVELTDIIRFPANEGNLLFETRQEQEDKNYWTFYNLLQYNEDFRDFIIEQWSFMKILGVKLIVVPSCRNQNDNLLTNACYISVFFGDNSPKDFNAIENNNYTLLLNPIQSQTAYFRNPNKLWINLTNYGPNVPGISNQVCVGALKTNDNGRGQRWAVRIQLLAAFKKSKI